MLRLYRNTIICSALALGICIVVSILCESFAFPHSGLIQSFSIGTACSLLVVVITTVLQYRYEHVKVFEKYRNRFQRLCNELSLIYEQMNDAEIDLVRKWLNDSIRATDECDKELVWFSCKKKKQQEKVRNELRYIIVAFEEQRYEQHSCFIEHLFGNEHIVELINQGIRFFPKLIDKEYLEKAKISAKEKLEPHNREF